MTSFGGRSWHQDLLVARITDLLVHLDGSSWMIHPPGSLTVTASLRGRQWGGPAYRTSPRTWWVLWRGGKWRRNDVDPTMWRVQTFKFSYCCSLPMVETVPKEDWSGCIVDDWVDRNNFCSSCIIQKGRWVYNSGKASIVLATKLDSRASIVSCKVCIHLIEVVNSLEISGHNLPTSAPLWPSAAPTPPLCFWE